MPVISMAFHAVVVATHEQHTTSFHSAQERTVFSSCTLRSGLARLWRSCHVTNNYKMNWWKGPIEKNYIQGYVNCLALTGMPRPTSRARWCQTKFFVGTHLGRVGLAINLFSLMLDICLVRQEDLHMPVILQLVMHHVQVIQPTFAVNPEKQFCRCA